MDYINKTFYNKEQIDNLLDREKSDNYGNIDNLRVDMEKILLEKVDKNGLNNFYDKKDIDGFNKNTNRDITILQDNLGYLNSNIYDKNYINTNFYDKKYIDSIYYDKTDINDKIKILNDSLVQKINKVGDSHTDIDMSNIPTFDYLKSNFYDKNYVNSNYYDRKYTDKEFLNLDDKIETVNSDMFNKVDKKYLTENYYNKQNIDDTLSSVFNKILERDSELVSEIDKKVNMEYLLQNYYDKKYYS